MIGQTFDLEAGVEVIVVVRLSIPFLLSVRCEAGTIAVIPAREIWRTWRIRIRGQTLLLKFELLKFDLGARVEVAVVSIVSSTLRSARRDENDSWIELTHCRFGARPEQ